MMESKSNTYDENKVVSIIGPGTAISGEVKSKGTIRVEGEVSGKIECEDTIVIHDSGNVKADLIAGQVVISGEVHGNVFAHDRLEVKPTGRVHGDIASPRIAIAEGVIFEGKCTMKPPGEMKPQLSKPAVKSESADNGQTSKQPDVKAAAS